MIKHADSVNFWQAAKERKRDKELRPAWWSNAVLPEATGLANLANVGTIFSKAPEGAFTHSADEIEQVIQHSGLDLSAAHKPPGRLAKLMQRHFPDIQNYEYRRGPGPGESPFNFGAHGQVGKMWHDPATRWHIPALAHEIGHAQEEHTMGEIPKLIQKARVTSGVGSLGSAIESFRALSNKARPVAERKDMLNRASIIGGVGAVPTLVNEIRASRNGLNLLKSLPVGNKAELLSEARRLYPRALSAYALMAAAPALAPQVAKLLLPKHVD